ncbi:LytR/AlgR family response regulator transcription factor [Nakamurella sp. GG22]
MASTESAIAGLVVLAVDDEAPALDEIGFLLGGDPRVGTVLTASNAAEALAMLQPTSSPTPDAVLLDIAMPGWDGVDLARVVSALPHPPAVAFLSAHDDRAVDAYEIGAVDYLLKPVRPARLAEAVTRFCAARDAAAEQDRRHQRVAAHGDPAGGAEARVVEPAVTHVGEQDDQREDGAVIAVDLAGKTRFVPRDSVCWAEAQGDYARLHVEGGDSHLIRTPLAVLQEEWAAAGFVRVHRGYLVALHRIVELRSVDGGYRVGVSGQSAIAEIPVSRRHLRMLKQRLLAGRRPGR